MAGMNLEPQDRTGPGKFIPASGLHTLLHTHNSVPPAAVRSGLEESPTESQGPVSPRLTPDPPPGPSARSRTMVLAAALRFSRLSVSLVTRTWPGQTSLPSSSRKPWPNSSRSRPGCRARWHSLRVQVVLPDLLGFLPPCPLSKQDQLLRGVVDHDKLIDSSGRVEFTSRIFVTVGSDEQVCSFPKLSQGNVLRSVQHGAGAARSCCH